MNTPCDLYISTEIGPLPSDWKVVALETVALKDGLVRGPFGGALKKEFFVERGFKVYEQRNAIYRSVEIGDYFINEEKFKELSRFEVKDGDFIVSCSGTIGCIYQIPAKAPDGLINQALLKISLDTKKIFPKFFEALFRSKPFQERIKENSHGGAMQNLVGMEIFRKTLLPLPSQFEQQAIAEALSDADALIESLEQLLAKKRMIKQGAMQELLTGKKRLPGFKGEWQRRLLGDVITHCSSGATPYRGRPDFYEGNVKWITSGELNYNVITDTIEHISEDAVVRTNLKLHPPGTFLMAITGLEAAGTRGACGIVGSTATTNQSCMAIYPTSELKTEYLYHYYVCRGDELALRYCQGTKQQSYTAKLVKLLPIDLPPTAEEQTAIAEILSDMDAELAALEAKLEKARQIKQGMMAELLTGRIRLV